MENVIELYIQGDRNYIDIAQVSYWALSHLGIDVANNDLKNFQISLLKPLTCKVEIKKLQANHNPSIECLAHFSFEKNQTIFSYELHSFEQGLPLGEPLPEPVFTAENWMLAKDCIFWQKTVESRWPVFYAFMLMGRLSGIHLFGGVKPKGLTYSMARIPKPDEIEKLWVKKLRGPIKGLGIITLHCGEELIGLSKLKI